MKKILLGLLLFISINTFSQIINFTDPNFKQALLNHFPVIDTSGDGNISYNEASSVETLRISNSNISNLEEIRHFTSLRFLIAENNNIKFIDVRQNSLWTLRLTGNPLEVALLKGNSTFQMEGFYGISFDFDKIQFVCINQAQYGVQISNVSHARRVWNRLGTKLHFDCTNYPTPTSCEIINFPDISFKQKLLNHSPVIDIDGDGEICVDEARAATKLFVGRNSNDLLNISDFTGIENFINVDFAVLDNNRANSVDLSELKQLKILIAQKLTNLTSIDLSNNTKLERLGLDYNNLTSLDLSNNINLKQASIDFNNLSQLNINNNTKLEELTFHDNNVSSLNINFNPLLRDLGANNNKLTEFKITENNKKLEKILLKNNQLKEIDVRNADNISALLLNDNLNLEKLYLSENHHVTSNILNFISFVGIQGCAIDFVCLGSGNIADNLFNQIKNNVQTGVNNYTNATVLKDCSSPVGPIISLPSLYNYFALSPNPATYYIKLTKSDNTVIASTATISELSGLKVKTVNLKFGSGGIDLIELKPSFDNTISLNNSLGDSIQSATINISDLRPGTYIINVPSNKGILSGKFIKR